MSHACAAPIPWSRLTDYWAGDLEAAENDDIEEHMFGCAACTAELARVAHVVQSLRGTIPAVVDEAALQALRDQGLAIDENPVTAGTRREVTFRAGVDLLIHRLTGMDLSRAQRVEVIVRSESTGALLMEDHFAPFDRARGEVLIACQRHFALMPPDIVFDVHAHDEAGAVSTATFVVPHVFAGG